MPCCFFAEDVFVTSLALFSSFSDFWKLQLGQVLAELSRLSRS